MRPLIASALAALVLLVSGCARTVVVPGPDVTASQSPAMRALLDYLQAQKTTGFIVMRGGRTLVERNFAPPTDPGFAIFAYGTNSAGAMLEDVASQQKSFISMLVGVAIDRGLIDPARSVTSYLGPGWSRASAEQEAAIRVLDVLTMSSGLDDKFAYAAPPGTRFFYNTPVYAITKKLLAAAAGRPLDAITRDWLTGPAGMTETDWRERPAAFAGVGNATGLVTTPRDTAIFGRIVLSGGVAPNGRRIVSKGSLAAMFKPSKTNPAYGRLWWLNSGDYSIGALGARREGRLIPSAPSDLIAALGALDRKLYVVPSLDLVVVRMGADAPDADFDEQLWQRLRPIVE